MRYKLFILLPFILFFYTNLGAQINASYEASLNFGLASFQTDYGERGDFKSGVTGNVGLAVGASMYLNFFNNDPSFSPSPNWSQKHLKLKMEVSYLKANLNHFGRYVEENTADAVKLQNMSGSSSVINFGTILEYHPFAIPDYVIGKRKKVSPYIGGGIMAGYSMPKVEAVATIPAYQKENVIDVDSELTFSLMFSGGLRFKLDEVSAFIIDTRWQYFNSDYIDGLNPDTEFVPNKHNDWLYYLNVGYVFTFGKDSKASTWFLRKN